MSDVASLIIRVTTNGVDSATADLGKLGQAALKAGAAIGGLETARRVFESLVAAQRNFDKLNSGLITMTGSAENAAKAFSVLQQFAKETPYGLNQAVEGFTKLVALGLDPSKEALISYGNTASAMGKDLNDMIEAVADAATGEFERLKEFGIKASQNGDQVSFTFRGVTTTVKKSSEEIQKYLLNIGNTDFAGAMEVRSKTLDGALSSLADTFDGLVLNIAQSGFGDAMVEQAQTAEDAIQSLSDSLASDEMITSLETWATLFDESFKFISDGLNDLAFDADAKSTDISTSLSGVPDAIREWLPDIQETFYKVIAWFQRIDDYAVALAVSLRDVFDVSKTASITYKNMTAEADRTYEATIKWAKSESAAITERAKAGKAAAEQRRKEYEEQRKQQIDLRSLVKNQPGESSGSGSGSGSGSDKAAKAAAKLAEQQRKQAESFMEAVRRQNTDELAAIDEKEKQKLEKLDEFQKQGALKAGEYEKTKTQIALDADNERNELLKEQTAAHTKEQESADTLLAQIQAENETELGEFQRQQDKKLELLDEYHKKGLILEEQYNQAKDDLVKQSAIKQSTYAAQQFGDVFGNLSASLKEGSKEAKAFAVAQAIAQTYLSAVSAYQSASAIPVIGWVMGPIAAAAAVAAGLANVAKIRSAREQGGTLAAGQASTIAERNKPEVIMPASASRVRTAEQMRQIMGENSSSNGVTGVTIVNNTSSQISSARTEQDDEGRLRVIISEQVSMELQDSNSPISRSRRATRNQPGFA